MEILLSVTAFMIALTSVWYASHAMRKMDQQFNDFLSTNLKPLRQELGKQGGQIKALADVCLSQFIKAALPIHLGPFVKLSLGLTKLCFRHSQFFVCKSLLGGHANTLSNQLALEVFPFQVRPSAEEASPGPWIY